MSAALRDQMGPSKRSPRRLGGWLLLPLTVLVLAVFIGARQWRAQLVIEKVAVEGARVLPARDIVAMAAIQPPAFMYTADLFDARRRLLGQPFIKAATVIRDLPHTLKITVTERVPIASVAGSVIRYVDAECVVLPRPAAATVPFDLPLISGIAGLDTARYGLPVNDSDLVQAIEVLRAGQASGFYHAVSEVHMAPGADILLYAAEGGVPVILGRGDIDRKMATLQTFWSAFMKPDTLALLQYIDARFDGQIVVKRQPPVRARSVAPPESVQSAHQDPPVPEQLQM